jgi:hypothetical protein
MQPTQNLVPAKTGTPTPADVLRSAADYLSRYGFHQATDAWDNYDWSTDAAHPAASDVGAVTFAIYGEPIALPTPDGSEKFRLYRAAINAYVDWLELHLDRPEPTNSPQDWSKYEP